MALPLLLQRAVDAPARLMRGAAAAMLPIAIVCIYLTASRGGLIAGVAAVAVLVVLGSSRRETVVVGLAALVAGGALLVAAEGFASFRLAEPTASGDQQGALMLVAGIVAGAVVAWVALQRDRWAPRIRGFHRPRWVLPVAAIAIVVVSVVVLNPAQRLDELRQPLAFTTTKKAPRNELLSGSGNGRKEFWQAAEDAFSDQPLRGIGVGGYAGWFAQNGAVYYPVKDAHSLPLEVLAELGAIGFALLLVAAGCIVVAGFTRLRSSPERGDVAALLGLLAGAVIAVSIDWSWEIPALAFPVLIAAATLVGPAGSERAEIEVRATRSSRRVVLALAGIAIGGVAFWACLTSFMHSWRLEGSRSAAGEGDLVTAEERARDAIEVEPWAADAPAQLALVLERRGDVVGALAAIRSANRTDPWDGNLWFLRARIALTAGNVVEAQKALESARALRPRDPIFSIG